VSNKVVQVELCLGSSCYSKGSNKIVEELERKIKEGVFDVEVKIKGCLCAGMCTDSPIVKINNKVYSNVSPANIEKLVLDTINK